MLDVKTVLSNDSLSCLLSALEQALDDICSGKVELASSDEFMIVFDSYKTLSMSLLFFLTLDQGASGDGMSPSQDWVLTCNAWKLLSAYLCEAKLVILVVFRLPITKLFLLHKCFFILNLATWLVSDVPFWVHDDE